MGTFRIVKELHLPKIDKSFLTAQKTPLCSKQSFSYTRLSRNFCSAFICGKREPVIRVKLCSTSDAK